VNSHPDFCRHILPVWKEVNGLKLTGMNFDIWPNNWNQIFHFFGEEKVMAIISFLLSKLIFLWSVAENSWDFDPLCTLSFSDFTSRTREGEGGGGGGGVCQVREGFGLIF